MFYVAAPGNDFFLPEHPRYMKGGADTGFRHVKPTEYQPRLLHFCGTRKNIEVKEVRNSVAFSSSFDLFYPLILCVGICALHVFL